MLASGVAIGIAAGIAFGGDWRRLATFSLRWWPLLVIASALRLWTFFVPSADLAVYLAGLIGIGIVSAVNWRVAGAALIAIGTFANVLVVLANAGMPYDPSTATAVGAPPPTDALHVLLNEDTRLPFLSDIIPFGLGRAVYSVGDLLIAFGGFLIPFVWLQEEADPRTHSVRSANFAFFWLAQVISRFGDPITLIALTFVTYRATQSALLTTLAVGIASIPNALFGFFGGAIADAVGPRRAMFWCDLVREGFLFLRRSARLWSNTVFSLVAQFANPVINTLTPAFLIRRFAGDDAVAGAVLYAGSEAAIALGAVVGSAILPRYLKRVPKD